MASQLYRAVPIAEPVFVPEIFATTLAALREADGLVRLAYAAEREIVCRERPHESFAPSQAIIVCRLVIPASAHRRMLAQALAALPRES